MVKGLVPKTHMVTQLKRIYVFRRLFPQTSFVCELFYEALVNKTEVVVTVVAGTGAAV